MITQISSQMSTCALNVERLLFVVKGKGNGTCSGPGNSYLQSVQKGLSERQSLQETQSEESPGTALFQM